MKAELIELLQVPRSLIGSQVATETCERDGFLLPGDPVCAVCETRVECEWLFCNDELAALDAKPRDDLVRALDEALLYVDACVTRNGHDRRTCTCELCEWIERARTVIAKTTANECGRDFG